MKIVVVLSYLFEGIAADAIGSSFGKWFVGMFVSLKEGILLDLMIKAIVGFGILE